MPLFAVAGSQGTGKSTILSTLKERGYSIIERKTSRSILNDWGMTLEEINTDPLLTSRFQNEITARKLADEADAVSSPEIIFTERTHADLFSYALYAMGKYNAWSDWLDHYYETCKQNTMNTYKHVFFLPYGQFQIVPDGVRACNVRYSRALDTTLREITLEMFADNKDAITFIESRTVQARVSLIEQKVAQYLG